MHVRRWEKRNRSKFYSRSTKVLVVSIQIGGIETIASWGIESHFEQYQVLMLNLFKYFDKNNHTIFIQKCFSTLRLKYDPSSKIGSQWEKCLKTLNLYTTSPSLWTS